MYVHDTVNTIPQHSVTQLTYTRPSTSREALLQALASRPTEELEQLLISLDSPESPMDHDPAHIDTANFPTLPANKRPNEHVSSSSDSEPGTDSEIFIPVIPKGRKHRKVMPTHTDNTPPPVTTHNKFATLTKLEPPPIILPPHYTDMSSLITKLTAEKCTNYTIQRCKTGNKIFAKDHSTHNTIREKLTDYKTQFYSFTPKGSPKDQIFVLLGLDSDHPVERIKAGITSPHLKSVKRMTKTLPDGTRVPIPPVLLTFGPKFSPEKLKSIESIDQIKIFFKPYREDKGISQCFRCQRFGHTRKNCNLRERCVRCGKEHEAKNCDRANTPLECINCGAEHPASYRKCPFRLQLLEKSRRARQTIVPTQTSTTTSSAPTRTYRQADPTFSYASAITQQQTQPPPPPPTLPPRQALLPTPQELPQYPIHTQNIPQQHTSDGTPAWVERLTNTMTDMMTMLMSQFKTMMDLMNRLIPTK